MTSAPTGLVFTLADSHFFPTSRSTARPSRSTVYHGAIVVDGGAVALEKRLRIDAIDRDQGFLPLNLEMNPRKPRLGAGASWQLRVRLSGPAV